MLKKRLISIIFIMPTFISALLFLTPANFFILMFFVCILSAWEWSHIARLSSYNQRVLFTLFCGILLFLAVFNVLTSSYRTSISFWYIRYSLWVSVIWWLGALLLVLYYPRSARIWRSSKLIILVFGILTILPFFLGILALRQYHYDINHFTGAWWLLYVMVLVWSIDSGAYIFGFILGRHKLTPNVSPGKTWEGLIGGFLISLITVFFFKRIAPIDAPPFALLICSVIAILASVLGDLTESMFKREAGVKDSGYLIPGHGGILDRIDSLTSAIPVFSYFMLLVFRF